MPEITNYITDTVHTYANFYRRCVTISNLKKQISYTMNNKIMMNRQKKQAESRLLPPARGESENN